MSKTTEISVVIPVKNEAGNIDTLVSEIDESLKKFSYEIIYVNDGSEDNTELELKNNMKNNKKLRVICHENSQGQSAALRTGIKSSNSTLIATLDGDGQNDPSDLPKMIDTLKSCKDELVLIGGVRVNRKDSITRLWASSFAKYCRFILLKDTHPDSGCGIKVFHKELFLRLPYFDHMHRFLGALVLRTGSNVITVEVEHRARTAGKTKYGLGNRLWTGIVDLAGVLWLKRRAKHPIIKEVE